MIISGTYNLIADKSYALLQLQEIYLECNTSINPVTINLFSISDLQGFKNVKIYVSDIGNNASINNIVINTALGDEINSTGQTAFLINANGGCCILSIMSENKWSAFTQSITAQTGLTYKGTWNAATNNPTLTSGVGTNGYYYIVSNPGTTNLDGITDWQVGDWAIFETFWQKIDNHDVQAYNTVQEEGSSLPQRSAIDFQGTGVTASDNGTKTIVTVPIQPAYSTIQEEGSSLPQRSTVDFQGTGVTASDNGTKTIVTVPIQPAYSTIQEEGTSLPQRSTVDFQGTGVTATDNGVKTIVTIPGIVGSSVYGSFYDTTNQTGNAGSVLTMKLSNSDTWNTNVSIVSGTQIKVATPGVYNLAFSAQMVKVTGNSATHTHIWLAQNGLTVPYSGSQINFPSNSVYIIAAWNFFFETTNVNEYVELKWLINSNQNNAVIIETQPSSGSIPEVPSLIVTINRIN